MRLRTTTLAGLLFEFGGLDLLIISAAQQPRIGFIGVDKQLGLWGSLGPLGIVGLSLMAIGVCVTAVRSKRSAFALAAFLFFFTVWTVPGLFEVAPRTWDAYLHVRDAVELSSLGRIPYHPFSYVTNYPSAFLFFSATLSVGNLDPLLLLWVWPLFAASITWIALWVFLRTFTSGIDFRIALLLVTFADVYFQFHLSPQSLGFAILLLAVPRLMQLTTNSRVSLLLLMIFLGTGHPTSALLLGTTLGLVVISGITKRRESAGLRTFYNAFGFFSVLGFAWLLFVSVGYSTQILRSFAANVENFLRLDLILFSATQSRLGGVLNIGADIRLLVIGALGTFSMVSLARNRRSLLVRLGPPRFYVLVGLYLSAIPLTILDVSLLALGQSVRGVLVDRFFLAFVLCASVIVALSVGRPRGATISRESSRMARPAPRARRSPMYPVFVAILVVGSVNLLTIYYQEPLFVVGETSLGASDFIHISVGNGTVYGGRIVPAVWRAPDYRLIFYRNYFVLYPTPATSLPYRPFVMVFDVHDRLWYEQSYGVDIIEKYAADSSFFAVVYQNGDYEMRSSP